MTSDMERQLLQRLDEVNDKVGQVQVSMAKLSGVAEILRDHEIRMKKLETWQARLIGGYAAGAVLLGIAFQIVMSAI